MRLGYIVCTQAALRNMPACKGSCSLRHILLGVVTQPQREEFHQLTCIIFVRCSLRTCVQIEVDEHCWITRNAQQNIIEGIKGVITQKLVLHNHAHVPSLPTYFAKTAGEDSMPEQCHLL